MSGDMIGNVFQTFERIYETLDKLQTFKPSYEYNKQIDP